MRSYVSYIEFLAEIKAKQLYSLKALHRKDSILPSTCSRSFTEQDQIVKLRGNNFEQFFDDKFLQPYIV